MDPGNQKSRSMIRSALVITGVFLLARMFSSRDLVSEWSRLLVVWVVQQLGFHAADNVSSLELGTLIVPWSTDCSGLNLLIVLWAVILWINKSNPFSTTTAISMLLAAPAAFAANLGRIFTLVGYRHLAYPAVETQELHYLVGFLWLIPFLGFFTPRRRRQTGTSFVEAFYFASVFSLLSPLVHGPGGTFVAISAIIFLFKCRLVVLSAGAGLLAGAAWFTAAVAIHITGMESLWLPWLLVCPWFVSRHLAGSLAGLALLIATVPLAAMHLEIMCAVMAVVFVCVYRQRQNLSEWTGWGGGQGEITAPPALGRALLATALLFPFVAACTVGFPQNRELPPSGIMARETEFNRFELRLLGQSPDVRLVWMGPLSSGRHHSLPVCMRFRGISLEEANGAPGILTDGQQWFTEFFFVRGKVLSSYSSYLWHTSSPFSVPGAHLIVSAPVDSMSVEFFKSVASTLVSDLEFQFGNERGTAGTRVKSQTPRFQGAARIGIRGSDA
jgi:exosortase/archaeosortase family protein